MKDPQLASQIDQSQPLLTSNHQIEPDQPITSWRTAAIQPQQQQMSVEELRTHLVSRIFVAVASVIASSQISSYLILAPMLTRISNGKDINILAQSKQQIRHQVRILAGKMIRFESIAFGSKLILDYFYNEQIQRIKSYSQKKNRALTGLILYVANVPLMHLEKPPSPHLMVKYFNEGTHPMSPLRIVDKIKDFFTTQSLRSMLNGISALGVAGSVIYRSLYFGGYEKVRSYSEHPLNQFIVAPFLASVLGVFVMPLDNIRFMRQMPAYRHMPVLDIINSKEFKPYHLSNRALLSRIAKQSISMSLFVAGQRAYSRLFQRPSGH